MERAIGLVGLATMVGLAWLLSTDRRRVPWRLVGTGLLLQAAIGVIVLRTPFGKNFFEAANTAIAKLLDFTREGASFLFGNLVHPNVPVGTPIGDGPIESAPLEPGSIDAGPLLAETGASFAFTVLSAIVFT